MVYTIGNLGTHPRVSREAMDCIHSLSRKFVPGRYEFADGSFLNAEIYTTVSPEKKPYERHGEYDDVHIIFEGCERVLLAPVDSLFLKVVQPYSPEKDIEFLEGEEPYDDVELKVGDCLPVGIELAHKPGIWVEGRSVRVCKAVLKIPRRK